MQKTHTMSMSFAGTCFDKPIETRRYVVCNNEVYEIVYEGYPLITDWFA